MDSQTLVRMANRIGDFFEAMPDRAEALQGIVQHISRYWEPRMRRELQQRLQQGDVEGLKPIVAEALQADRGWQA
jgi:formate dehydrogenase subunit delta